MCLCWAPPNSWQGIQLHPSDLVVVPVCLGSCETHIPLPYIEESMFYFPGRLYWPCLNISTCFCLDNIGWGSWAVGESVGAHGLLVSPLGFMGCRCAHGKHREGEVQLWECPAVELWYYVHTLSLAEVGSMVLCLHPWVGRMDSVGLCIYLVWVDGMRLVGAVMGRYREVKSVALYAHPVQTSTVASKGKGS